MTSDGAAAARSASGPDKPGEEPKSTAKDKVPPNPVRLAVEKFVHRVRDIRLAGRYASAAAREQRLEYEALSKAIKESLEKVQSESPQTRGFGIQENIIAVLRIHRLMNSLPAQVICRGLFLALFSAFDAFTGQLIRALYARRPDLYGSINRDIVFKDVLKAIDLETLKVNVLDEDIETLRRKSYVEQFADLSRRFDVPLTDFPSWKNFVECAQRRNLITHCDGVVTQQYLDQCRVVGFTADELPALGSVAEPIPRYLGDSCELLIEVGVKLGHSLWRKVLPDELREADGALNRLVYDALYIENWQRAKTLGHFAFAQKRFHDEVLRRMSAINYVQAIKWGGGSDAEWKKILDSFDWSASAFDFRLAAEVLREDNDAAAALMRQIGRKTELLEERAYYEWPLFRIFRTTQQFQQAFSDVYGYTFVGKVTESATAATAEADRMRDRGVEPGQSTG